MSFFGFPIEIWIASLIAVMFRLKKTESWTVIGVMSSVSIALFSGLILYMPVVELLSLSSSWHVPIAILIAITFENIMESVLDMSKDKDFVKDWLRFILSRKLDSNNEKEKSKNE